MFLMIIISILTFVSATCQLNILSGTTTIDSSYHQYDCIYVAPGAILSCSGNSLNLTAINNITIKGTITCLSKFAGGPGGNGQPSPGQDGSTGTGPSPGGGGSKSGSRGGGGGGSGGIGGLGGIQEVLVDQL